ncbi:MAG: hypothetical protein ACK5KO_11705 [Arachnia sp.]
MVAADGHQRFEGLEGLDDEFARLEREFEPGLLLYVQVVLARICRRRTPLRAVSPSPVKGVGRLRFADGVTVLGRTPHPGELGSVVVWLHQGIALTIDQLGRDERGIRIEFAPQGYRSLRVWVIGIDQAD